jgi:hypothetical protein
MAPLGPPFLLSPSSFPAHPRASRPAHHRGGHGRCPPPPPLGPSTAARRASPPNPAEGNPGFCGGSGAKVVWRGACPFQGTRPTTDQSGAFGAEPGEPVTARLAAGQGGAPGVGRARLPAAGPLAKGAGPAAERGTLHGARQAQGWPTKRGSNARPDARPWGEVQMPPVKFSGKLPGGQQGRAGCAVNPNPLASERFPRPPRSRAAAAPGGRRSAPARRKAGEGH